MLKQNEYVSLMKVKLKRALALRGDNVRALYRETM